VVIPAGTRIPAELLSDALPLAVVLAADVSAINDITSDNVPGLTLTLAAASTYLIDGYLAYTAGATGDIRLSWSAPNGWTGSWSWLGLDQASVGSVGNINVLSVGVIEGVAVPFGGSDLFGSTLAARLCMYVETDAEAGDLVPRFAQVVSSATPTTVRQGSWLRAQKVT
jgi:hypothetical protein